jgi:uncharacterized protein (TIGR03435 family)
LQINEAPGISIVDRHKMLRRAVSSLGLKMQSLAVGLAIVGILALPGAAEAQAFEIASVKDHQGPKGGARDIRASYEPQGIDLVQSMIGLIADAYRFNGGQIVMPLSLPNSLLFGGLGDGYEIVAHTDQPASMEQIRLMLQGLLADRFKLAVHRETKTAQAYRLAVTKDGPRLGEPDGADPVVTRTSDGYTFRNAGMSRLSGVLSSYLDRIAVAETGLSGSYNFTFKLPEDVLLNPARKSDVGSPDAAFAGAFANALK